MRPVSVCEFYDSSTLRAASFLISILISTFPFNFFLNVKEKKSVYDVKLVSKLVG